jgi:hypothetical protein
MLVGYARTSTLDQMAGIEAQLKELHEAGCEKVFSEQVSSVDVVNLANPAKGATSAPGKGRDSMLHTSSR